MRVRKYFNKFDYFIIISHFSLIFHNVNVFADGNLKFSDEKFTITTLLLKLKFDRLDTNFRGLYGGNNPYEEFVNEAISEKASDIIEYMWPELEPVFVQFIKEQGDGLLKDVTVMDLTTILMGTKPLFPPLPWTRA